LHKEEFYKEKEIEGGQKKI